MEANGTIEMHQFVNFVRTFEEVVQTETLVVLYESDENDSTL